MSGAELYLVASLVGAGATYAKAKADARNLKSQAYQAEIKGRVDRANYKQQGIETLKEMNKVMSANVARAFSGNLDPFRSGETPDIIQSYSLRAGINDYTISRDNATIVMKQAQYQAESLRASARDTMRFATLQLVGSVAMAGYNYSTIGSAPATPATSNTFLDPSFTDFGTTGTRSQFMNPIRPRNRFMPSGQ
ncbi:MAG: hypothetical protein CBC44_003970 [Flavobacteriales bacterium TMED84]|nr:MAG: hypothetical protein CBC44_003970 [Flavobacteriales bacterium TMED84]|tara:strand:+ start:2780 stop:3361 length:582 start_codon:yes stop_codon:yes gene_type:complete